MPRGKLKRPAAGIRTLSRKLSRKSRKPTVSSDSPVGRSRRSQLYRSRRSQLDDKIITAADAPSRKGTSAVIVMVVLAVMALATIFSPRGRTTPVTKTMKAATTKPATTEPATTTNAATVPGTISPEPVTTTKTIEKTILIVLAVGIVLSTAAYCYLSDRSSLAYLMAFVLLMYVCVALYSWAASNSDAIQQNAYRWTVTGLGIFMTFVLLVSTFVLQVGTALFMMLGSMMVSAAYFMLAQGTDFVSANAAMVSRLGLVVFLAMATYWKFGGTSAFVMAFCAASLLSISLPLGEAPIVDTEAGKALVVFNKDAGGSSPVLKEPLSLVDSFVAAIASLPMLVLIVALPMILIKSDDSEAPLFVFNLLAVTSLAVLVQKFDVIFPVPPSTLSAAS